MKLTGLQKDKSKSRTRSTSSPDDGLKLLSLTDDFYTRESYKTLRSNVSFSLTGEEKSNVVIVTSSFQGEGKSITAINLGISFAQAEKRVVIIDCDLRRPKLARELGIRGKKSGLSNLLMEPELFSETLVHTDVPRLDAILAGSVPPNPSELLGSKRMTNLLATLKRQYDLIILDTPPVNMVTDAAVLVEESSGGLVVVRAGVAEKGDVIRAVEQLEYAKAKILGFVLNGVSKGSGKYGYGYGKYGRYGYGRYGRYGGYGHYEYGPSEDNEDTE